MTYTLLKKTLGILVFLITFSFVQITQAFTDVSDSHWAAGYIEEVQNLGIVDGYADGTFQPNGLVNRAEVAKIAVKVAEMKGVIDDASDLSGAPNFSDIPAGQWFSDYVRAAAKAGMVEGYRDGNGNLTGRFGAGDIITRAQAAKIFAVAANVPANVTLFDPGGEFLDVSATDWFYKWVAVMYTNSVIDGYKDGQGNSIQKFGPNDPVTRAQLAKIVAAALNPVTKTPPVISVEEEAADMSGLYSMGAPASGNIGFSTGGAKDINNFRENIENGYLPLPTDITYEGLFYDYYFDTGMQEACMHLFCPSFTYAVAKDPLSGEKDYYLSVGLNSGIKESDFERKKLNLTVVLDISGSMGSPFDEYYYDQLDLEVTEEEKNMSKMQVATQAVVGLLSQLDEGDRLSIVLFDDDSEVLVPMSSFADLNSVELQNKILAVTDQGGTNMYAGMSEGTKQFEGYDNSDTEVYENRMIFLTDAMPNTGYTGDGDLFDVVEANAADGIYTTFIGIGLDFNTELIESISKVRGANYYSVHSPKEFKEQLDENFSFMVTPLVFDLELNFESVGYEIAQVYGSPDANTASGSLMSVNTLFPSPVKDGQTRGGLVLLKLNKVGTDPNITLTASYKDRSQQEYTVDDTFTMGDHLADFYQNLGIRKGVVLARYADLLKNWMIDERIRLKKDDPIMYEPYVTEDVGIIVPLPPEKITSEWERTSVDLTVMEEYESMIEKFLKYLNEEMIIIGDEELDQEVKVLEILTNL